MNEGPLHNEVPNQQERKLFFVLCLTGFIMLVEVAGGYLSGSLALLADAGHMFTDVAALGMSWLATRVSSRQPDSERTYGYQRLRILAAYTNGILLFFLSGIIGVEALDRVFKPHPIQGELMLGVALVGLATNAASYFILSHGGHGVHHHHGHDHAHDHTHEGEHHEHESAGKIVDLNVHSAAVHVVSDLLGSLGAVVAALVIMFTGWSYADPLVSILVSILIFFYAIGLVRKTTNILIEAAPDKNISEKIRTLLTKEVTGVLDVHHIHVWSLTESQVLATMDVTVEPRVDEQATLCAIRRKLLEELKLDHVTIQIEKGPCMGFDL